MKETTGQDQPKRKKKKAGNTPELRVVGIDFKPAPDAEDRLRRLFTILARMVEDDSATLEADPSADDDGEGEG